MTDLELDLMIAEVALQEATDSFNNLREEYHALREYADKLEELLKKNNIDYPEFWG